MKIGFISMTAGLVAFSLATPALANNDRYHHDPAEWRENRDDDRANHRAEWGNRSEAYRQGYRDGVRSERRNDRRTRGRHEDRDFDGRRDRGYWVHDRPVYARPMHRGPAASQPWHNGSRWTSRGGDPYYWGRNGSVHCRRSDGTTGTIMGAATGGTLGAILGRQGNREIGAVIGGSVGAIIGRELERGNLRCR